MESHTHATPTHTIYGNTIPSCNSLSTVLIGACSASLSRFLWYASNEWGSGGQWLLAGLNHSTPLGSQLVQVCVDACMIQQQVVGSLRTLSSIVLTLGSDHTHNGHGKGVGDNGWHCPNKDSVLVTHTVVVRSYGHRIYRPEIIMPE